MCWADGVAPGAIVDFVWRSVNCRLWVRPFPKSLGVFFAESFLVEPLLTNSLRETEVVVRGYQQRMGPGVLALCGVGDSDLRTCCAHGASREWKSLDQVLEDPALDVYGKNACTQVEVLQHFSLVKKSVRVCTEAPFDWSKVGEGDFSATPTLCSVTLACCKRSGN